MQVRVYYEDCDVGGILYHSKYFNFCERARSELFFERGKAPIYKEYHFVVKHIDASFKQPAYFGDLLEVKTKLIQKRSASLLLKQTLMREEELLFSMEILLVCLKGEKPAKIPNYFLEIFQEA